MRILNLLALVFVAQIAFSGCSGEGVPGGHDEPAVPADEKPVWIGSLPSDEIQVWGNLIDIRTVYNTKELQVFPQNENYTFGADAKLACGGNPQYAVGLVDMDGPEWVRAGSAATVFMASEFQDLKDGDWVSTGGQFRVGELTYYLHRYTGRDQRTGIKVPRPGKQTCSPMIIGPKVKVNGTREYGTVITRSDGPRATSKINNATLVITPSGDYLASCTGSEGDSSPRFFISSDKGLTWTRYGSYNLSVNKIANMYNLFVHDGVLYMMGLGGSHANLYICKSTDNGKTWSVPSDKNSGLILEGTFHSASVPVAVAGGRIWRACELYASADVDKCPFMLSASLSNDFLKSSSWQQTNIFRDTKYYVSGSNVNVSGLTEGNALVGPDGTVYNFLRSNCTKNSGFGTLLKVTGTTQLAFAPEKYCVDFPGGGKKFTIRYDDVSKCYWALTNPDTDYPANGKLTHAGMDGSNLSHSLMRNRLVLLKSADLRNWKTVDDKILYDPDPFFHGFQYADWVIDGDDIIAVVRTAIPEADGLPIRQHDANRMLFIRINQFRNK